MSLRLSSDLRLPIDAAGETIAILAKRGAGKTNTATVLVEELVAGDVQTVILDPVGAWWGVRSSAAGERGAGLPVPIIGGQHGDVPLEQTAGALMADVVTDSPESILLDLSDFPSKGAVSQFVTAFAERLYHRKARQSSLLHLVLEEADSFAPQTGKGTERMRGAIEQLVRRGRSRGIGVTLVTQRSAVLNKDVLTQADVLVVMRTTGPHDIRAIREWIVSRGDEHGDEVLQSLPALQTGEAWVWSPERDMLKRTKIRRRRTFDSSATPKPGERREEPEERAPIDLTKLGERILATAEKAKADDPAALRRRIAELERQVQAQPRAPDPVEVVREVEVPVLNGQVEQLEQAAASLRDAAGMVEGAASSIVEALDRWSGRPRAEQVERREVARKPSTASSARPPARRPVPPASESRMDFHPSSSQQRILDSLAALAAIGVDQPDKTQLALFAEASPKSSGYTNNLGALRTAGMIDYPAPKRVSLTDAGAALADSTAAPSTAEEMQAYVYSLVGSSRARIVQALVDAYPEAIEKRELAELIGVSASSSGYTNNLGSLRSLGLLDYPSPGFVQATPILFLEGALA